MPDGHPSGNASIASGDPLLGEIVRRLVEVYRPERIYLFGSHACGDAGPDSDYDLLVVVPDDTPDAARDEARAYAALWGAGRSGDILVWRRSAFDRRACVEASLPGTVLREGKLLYVA